MKRVCDLPGVYVLVVGIGRLRRCRLSLGWSDFLPLEKETSTDAGDFLQLLPGKSGGGALKLAATWGGDMLGVPG